MLSARTLAVATALSLAVTPASSWFVDYPHRAMRSPFARTSRALSPFAAPWEAAFDDAVAAVFEDMDALLAPRVLKGPLPTVNVGRGDDESFNIHVNHIGAKDLKVDVDDDVITVSGTSVDGRYRVRKALRLPRAIVNAEAIVASLEDNRLSVSVPVDALAKIAPPLKSSVPVKMAPADAVAAARSENGPTAVDKPGAPTDFTVSDAEDEYEGLGDI